MLTTKITKNDNSLKRRRLKFLSLCELIKSLLFTKKTNIKLTTQFKFKSESNKGCSVHYVLE